ncbi:MAG: DUF3024 domain-containing protein [Azospirillaceae bacterium]|nr:DUF3024 domain-containing protein [Azospirillaceae bacterium]
MGISIEAPMVKTASRPGYQQPNDLDRKRIERTLKARKRYRYVSPRVLPVPGGYRIESPCCSRNIAGDGAVVDVALLTYQDDSGSWTLYRKDHAAGAWEYHNSYGRLIDLLEQLNVDPDRKFWQ